MKLAVTDANIFIDLIRLKLLHCLFTIEFDIHTTENVAAELKLSQYNLILPYIENGSLKMHLLSQAELNETSSLNVTKKLSPQDISVMFLALKIHAAVLTGDNVLRKHCLKAQLEVHGILWLFDVFISTGVITKRDAILKLELLISQNNRLPKEESNMRLSEWRKD